VNTVESLLRQKARRFLRRHRGRRRPVVEPIFRRRAYIAPHDLSVENYLRPRPLAAFNPGVARRGAKVYLFPRLVFDYYSYASSIGLCELEAGALRSGEIPRPLRTRILLWPQYLWEAVRGCEDARVLPVEDGFWILYTGVGKIGRDRRTEHKDIHRSLLAFADLDLEGKVRRKLPIGVEWKGRSTLLPNKDSAFIRVENPRAVLVTRPSLPGMPDMGWRGELDLRRMAFDAESLEPILAPEPFEYKVG